MAAGACATPRRSHAQPCRCGYATHRTNRGRSRSWRSSGDRLRGRPTGNIRSRLVRRRGGGLRLHPGRSGKPHPTEGRTGRAIPASTGRRRALPPTSRRAQAAATNGTTAWAHEETEERANTRCCALARTPHAAHLRGVCARSPHIRLHSARSTLSRRRIGVGAEMGAGPPKCAKAGVRHLGRRRRLLRGPELISQRGRALLRRRAHTSPSASANELEPGLRRGAPSRPPTDPATIPSPHSPLPPTQQPDPPADPCSCNPTHAR